LKNASSMRAMLDFERSSTCMSPAASFTLPASTPIDSASAHDALALGLDLGVDVGLGEALEAVEARLQLRLDRRGSVVALILARGGARASTRRWYARSSSRVIGSPAAVSVRGARPSAATPSPRRSAQQLGRRSASRRRGGELWP
jgi:hypothetical protein